MKINRLFALGALILSSLALVSCGSDDDSYTPGGVDDGLYLYVPSNSITFTPTDKQTFTIQIGRTAAEKAKAATVSLTGDNDAFTYPSTVSFTAGQENATVEVTSNIPAGQSETITFALPKESATVYGLDSLTITVVCDYNWEAAGSGTFTDNTFTSASATVKVLHAEGTDIYRLVNPFVAVSKAGGDFGGTPNDQSIDFTMDKTGKVGFEDGVYDLVPGTENGVYQMYYNSAKYSNYCNFTNDEGMLIWNFLLLQGTKLYTGGNLTFEWTTDYPVE